MKKTSRAVSAAKDIKTVRTYVTQVTDEQGHQCTLEEVEKYAKPVLALWPELRGMFTQPYVVEFGKRLETHGLLPK
jgi:hypothetical protein